MNVLGIIGFGQNPAAALLMDGKLVAFAEEERFTRLKGSDDMFPGKAVAYCLNSAHLPLDGVDRIAFGWNTSKYPWRMFRHYASNFLKYRRREKGGHVQHDSHAKFTAVKSLLAYTPGVIRTQIQEGLRSVGLAGRFPKIEFFPHHLAHAYSAYFCSDFQRAGILTLDGSAEDICAELAIGEGDDVRVVERFNIPHSLGWFYAAITEYLGFIPYRDEGKLMGLAALGEERRDTNRWLEPLAKMLKIQDGGYEVDPIYTKFGGHYYGSRYTDEMVKLLTSVDPQARPIMYGEKSSGDNGTAKSRYMLPTYVDMAWAAQELLEQAAVTLGRKMVEKYNVENLCVAGGVAMNCKMNGEILRRTGCKNIFVQPASHDAGTALGAAMGVAQQLGDNVRNPLKNCYYGPGFTNDQIRSDLKNLKVSFTETDRPCEAAADLITQGKIIAWFQGRMEFGSRALGGRSILANPVHANIKDKVNAEVKYRESWRPFCPSMLDEVKHQYLDKPNEASFMIVAYHVNEAVREKVPGIVHVDGTVRPQAVTKEASPRFYDLISEVGRQTGHPVVLNTSFNVRGEPIICTPLEAVRCFYSNGLDALVIGDFVLEKQHSRAPRESMLVGARE